MEKDKNLISIDDAASLVADGNLIIHATDTVFGISGAYHSKKAYDLIYKVKKRSSNKPLGILLSTPEQIMLFSSISLKELTDIFPLLYLGITVILPMKEGICAHLTEQSESIGVRIPNHLPTKELIEKTGPLISTSANISGASPISSKEEASNLLIDNVYFLEGNTSGNSVPSTIIKFSKGNYMLIREGSTPIIGFSKHITLSLNE